MASYDYDLARFWALYFPSAFITQKNFMPDRVSFAPEIWDADYIHKWLVSACTRFDLQPTQLARKANISPSTINRFLKGNGPKNLSASTINSISETLLDIYTKNFRKHSLEISKPLSADMTVVGEISINNHNNIFEWESIRKLKLQVPMPLEYIDFYALGISVRGDGFEPAYTGGSILICVPFNALLRTPRERERVIVHSRLANGDIASSIRTYSIDPQGDPWLLPVCSNKTGGGEKAIYVGSLGDHIFDDDVFISSLVVSRIVPEPYISMQPSP